MNLNIKQVFSIVVAVLSVLMVSTTQLSELFGSGVAKTIVTSAGLANAILSSVVAAWTSQSATLQDVRSMPGVENILVNSKANQTLAKLAVDKNEDKIAPIPAAVEAVTQTAEGTPI